MAEADPEPTTGSPPEVSRRSWNVGLALNAVCFFPPLLGVGFFVVYRPKHGWAYIGIGLLLLALPYGALGIDVAFGDWETAPTFTVMAVLAFAALLFAWISSIALVHQWRREALLQQDAPPA